MSHKANDNPFDLKPLTVEVTYDTPFKYIFAVPNETEEILTQLLNDLLCLEGPKKIIELSYENVELISDDREGRCLILDLKVKDQADRVYNIEVQRRDSDPIITRAIYQSSRLTGEQLDHGQKFRALKPVVCVLLCNYSTFPDSKALRVFKLVPFDLKDQDQRQVLPFKSKDFDPVDYPRYTKLKKRVAEAEKSLEHLSIYLVELDKKDSELSEFQKLWLKFLLSSTTYPYNKTQADLGDDMGEYTVKYSDEYFVTPNASEQTLQRIKEAQERLHRFAADPASRDLYFREQLERITYNSNMSNAYEDGLEKGLEQGLEKGRTLQLKSTIEHMADAGLSDEQIAKFLNLSTERLQELKQQ